MNHKFLPLLFFIPFFFSCNTVYQIGQTPDDVYFSPIRGNAEKVVKDKDYQDNHEEQQIRMGIRNRRWLLFNDDIYGLPYSFGSYYPNNYYGFYNINGIPYYQPFYYPYYFYYPTSTPKNSTPNFGHAGGNNNGYNNSNNGSTNSIKYGGIKPSRSYNNSNEKTREDFNDNPTNRSYNSSPSSSPSGGSSSGNSSGNGVTRPSRGGGGH